MALRFIFSKELECEDEVYILIAYFMNDAAETPVKSHDIIKAVAHDDVALQMRGLLLINVWALAFALTSCLSASAQKC